MKPIGPLFKVFGSKWSSSKHYPAPLQNKNIYEPFAGGAGYSCRYHQFPITIYEINPYLSYLWQWLINTATTEDILNIPLDLKEGSDIRDISDLNYGQQVLLKNWMRTNNVGHCWTVSPWATKPGQWTANTRARVAEEIHAIKHWKFEPIAWDKPGTYMCDPPYFYNYRYGIKDFDFQSYVANVGRVPEGSLIICCEAVESKINRVPDYLPFTPSHSQVTSRRKKTNNHHSKELVYVKYT